MQSVDATSNDDARGRGPLDGLRVIDLTTVIMGPYATAMLGDLGADVVKVETPQGDMTRHVGRSQTPGLGPLTLNLQRNKRSVALDLNAAEDRTAFDDLVAGADVVITNLRPKSRRKLGLTYEQLQAVRHDLIFCTAQAYGSMTPRADEPAYDDIVQAASGFAMIPVLAGEEPAYTRSVIADKVCAFAINQAVLAAVVNRERTGEGQWVDVPMADTMISFNLVEHLFQATRCESTEPVGWTRVLAPNRKPMRTGDGGWICLLPYSDQNWRDLLQAIGRDDLLDDPRVATMNSRNAHMGFLLGILTEASPSRTTAQWLEICEHLRVPAAELLDVRRVTDDPYVRGQGILQHGVHPDEGRYWALSTPVHFSRTPIRAPRPAPPLGADNAALVGTPIVPAGRPNGHPHSA
ncbi:CaiB/BaiF CoA transferase family protein [Actinomadura madurae]|uniref:CaiB/BaiF CoA transferase family protein n=1 Tax=Actinomadura madurae TaxID=1993 RepID=UPI000D90A7E3|nr:CoA transferase [Actinomadura madurae]SPT51274.1 Formyl-coenzyme A transferase [Actinomadura madurae]